MGGKKKGKVLFRYMCPVCLNVYSNSTKYKRHYYKCAKTHGYLEYLHEVDVEDIKTMFSQDWSKYCSKFWVWKDGVEVPRNV